MGETVNPAFSILGRIGGDATFIPYLAGLLGPIILFQYPRSDRRRCNSKRRLAPSSFYHRLSVSSVGSEAMQPFL